MVLIALFGCDNKSVYHFYSPSKEQSISVITNDSIRYIINGYYTSIPKSNYVKINLSKIDRSVGDVIAGCWNKENLKWIIMMDNVIVLDNKLDTTKFLFKNNFPRDAFDIPTLKGYDSKIKNCFTISFDHRELTYINGSISN